MSIKLSEIEAEPLDITRESRDVWLAKVPHFVSGAWRSPASGSVDVGRLRMVMDPSAEPGTSEAAPQMTVHVTGNEAASMPREFQLNFQKGFAPMQLFSESPQGQVAVEGKITHKFDMQPKTMDAAYHKLFQDRVMKATSKTRYSQVLEEDHRTGLTVIPISDERGKGVAPLAPGAKKSDSRRARDLSPEDLRDLLFALFERKPRWTLKDLVTETRQPHSFLKEVLTDVAVYNKRGEFQGSYELKADFRPVEEAQ